MGGLIGIKPPKQPKPEPVARMPDPYSPDVVEAGRRKRREILALKGRASTILSDDRGDYRNDKLGD
jgi:hypothetical protein